MRLGLLLTSSWLWKYQLGKRKGTLTWWYLLHKPHLRVLLQDIVQRFHLLPIWRDLLLPCGPRLLWLSLGRDTLSLIGVGAVFTVAITKAIRNHILNYKTWWAWRFGCYHPVILACDCFFKWFINPSIVGPYQFSKCWFLPISQYRLLCTT